ncbi:MAG: thiol-disulfide oxidoreductase DCC family protein [Bosea sp. (in: a-proteobacteria)]
MPAEAPALTVYYDGACPLCRAEIGHYRSQPGAERICFTDVARADESTGQDLPRGDAMARFHVRDAQGRLVSGAAAFVLVWSTLPRWRWAARIARLPGVTPLLELGYRLFLPVRPLLSRVVARAAAGRR